MIEQFERAAGFTREDSPEQKLDKMQACSWGPRPKSQSSAPLFAALLSLPIERYPPLNLSPRSRRRRRWRRWRGQVEALAKRSRC